LFIHVVAVLFLAIATDVQAHKRFFLFLVSSGMLCMGVMLLIACGSAVVENFYRERYGDYQFIALGRYHAPESNSCIYSQFLMIFGSLLGIWAMAGGLIFFGVISAVSFRLCSVVPQK